MRGFRRGPRGKLLTVGDLNVTTTRRFVAANGDAHADHVRRTVRGPDVRRPMPAVVGLIVDTSSTAANVDVSGWREMVGPDAGFSPAQPASSVEDRERITAPGTPVGHRTR